MPSAAESSRHWYSGINGYQWLVLTIASLGWIFDVFEGPVFVASMNEAMPALLPKPAGGVLASHGCFAELLQGRLAPSLYNNIALGAFLAGGALGGVVFGAL